MIEEGKALTTPLEKELGTPPIQVIMHGVTRLLLHSVLSTRVYIEDPLAPLPSKDVLNTHLTQCGLGELIHKKA